LSDRYELPDGDVFVTGIHALVRVLLDQHRADVAAGLRTATLVSGYQGSPLGGFDREVAGLGKLATDNEIVLRPALNEELGATAVWGSQLLDSYDGPRVDGVTGVWYGKSPGVDRASDAIRHGNIVGTHPHGGVLALAGDDPACKSSTVPGASEPLLAAMQVPVIAPGNVQEVLDFGRHAIACSRASGLWSAEGRHQRLRRCRHRARRCRPGQTGRPDTRVAGQAVRPSAARATAVPVVTRVRADDGRDPATAGEVVRPCKRAEPGDPFEPRCPDRGDRLRHHRA
jgi:TPP-dependent indolepyruvate ferredoxin oxidoreductase alpha subunit